MFSCSSDPRIAFGPIGKGFLVLLWALLVDDNLKNAGFVIKDKSFIPAEVFEGCSLPEIFQK